MKLSEIITALEDFAPTNYQEKYDNSGLIVGNTDSQISKALICIDSTEEIIEEAIENKCELVIAHHPIVFDGLKRFTGANYVQRTVMKAIKNDIAIYAAHTNLDNVYQGVNSKIAEKLGLLSCEILAPKNKLLNKLYTFCPTDHAEKVREALFLAGAGKIGNYDQCSYNQTGEGTFRPLEGTTPFIGDKGKMHKELEQKIEVIFPENRKPQIIAALCAAHPYEEVAYDIIALENEFSKVGSGMVGLLDSPLEELEFLQLVKEQLQTDCIRHTAFLNRKVSKVAICGGSGSFLLPMAIQSGADVFITADYKYHQFFDADSKIIIADIGHYESEQFTTEVIAGVLKEKFTTFALHFSKVNTNPINYL